jgi:hypothetical protein
MIFSESEISQYALPAMIERGNSVHMDGAVQRMWSSGEEIIAIVHDHEAHRVVVSKKPDVPVYFDCSCEFSFGGACEHVVAVMLAASRGGAIESIASLKSVAPKAGSALMPEEQSSAVNDASCETSRIEPLSLLTFEDRPVCRL